MGEETKAAAGADAVESRLADRGGENAGYVYDAFISYRHCPLDQYVAEILHKRLEAFRLPKGVQKRLSDNRRTKIKRVFRDREELPLASNLAEPITRAHRRSAGVRPRRGSALLFSCFCLGRNYFCQSQV